MFENINYSLDHHHHYHLYYRLYGFDDGDGKKIIKKFVRKLDHRSLPILNSVTVFCLYSFIAILFNQMNYFNL